MSDININEVVDKVVTTAKDWAGVAAQLATQGFDLGKAEYEIKTSELKLERAYKALGRLAYEVETGALNRDDEVFGAAIAQIKEALEKIEGLKASMTEIKSREIVRSKPTAEKKAEEACEDLEKTVEDAVEDVKDFFESAAEKAAETVEKVEEKAEGCLLMKFCPVCGVGNEPDAAKCTNCGHEF